jgi:hypothetical protein
MEPLKPQTKAQILEERPQVSPAEIEEYERLLTERFASDPDVVSRVAEDIANAREMRLRQLYEKLFGGR